MGFVLVFAFNKSKPQRQSPGCEYDSREREWDKVQTVVCSLSFLLWGTDNPAHALRSAVASSRVTLILLFLFVHASISVCGVQLQESTYSIWSHDGRSSQ